MNRSNFEHAGIALLLFAGLYLLTRDVLAAALAPVFLFVGREQAQRFRNLSDAQDPHALVRSLMFWQWTLDEKLDALFPIIACATAAYLMTTLGG